jgi:hypothetical protein
MVGGWAFVLADWSVCCGCQPQGTTQRSAGNENAHRGWVYLGALAFFWRLRAQQPKDFLLTLLVQQRKGIICCPSSQPGA